MGKSLFIAEKPSVAQQFGAALGENLSRRDGYLEGEHMVITWCVGHLVTMSYPDVYDEKYKMAFGDTSFFTDGVQIRGHIFKCQAVWYCYQPDEAGRCGYHLCLYGLGT